MTDHDDEEFINFYDDSLDIEEDDFQESIGQNDPIGSSDSEHLPKKRSRTLPFLFIIMFLGGSGFCYYHFFMKEKFAYDVPVIRVEPGVLENAQLNSEVLSKSIEQKDTDFGVDVAETHDSDQQNLDDKSQISVFAEDLYESQTFDQKNVSITESSENQSIITPLPSFEEIQNTTLLSIEEDFPSHSDDAADKNIDDTANTGKLEIPESILQNNKPAVQSESQDITVEPSQGSESVDLVESEDIFVEELVPVPPPSENTNSNESQSIRIITPTRPKDAEVKQHEQATKPAVQIKPKAIETQKAKPTVSAKNTEKSDKNQWVIKAVLPGQAVIHDKLSGETRSVEIGDFVKTIGTIKSIKKVSNKWVVTGSLVEITQ